MSFKYSHAGVYRCDEDGCKNKQLSLDGDLPEGWTEQAIEVPGVIYDGTDLLMQHRCPACSQREAAA